MKWNKRTKNECLRDREKGYTTKPIIIDQKDEIETYFGLEIVILSADHIKALIEGKALNFGINCGEFAVLMFLDNN